MSFIPVPDFAKELLLRQKCPFCAASYTEQDVTAAGNRRAKDKKTYFFYEVECSSCGSPSMTIMTSRPCDMYGMAMYVAQMYRQLNETGEDDRVPIKMEVSKIVNNQKSKITDEEISRVKRILDTVTSHEDFLLRIGMTPEQIKGCQSDSEDDLEGEEHESE